MEIETSKLLLENHYPEEYWRMHYAGLAMQTLLSKTDNEYYVITKSFEIADVMIAESKKVNE